MTNKRETTPWQTLQRRLNLAGTCKQPNQSEYYLIVIMDSFKNLYEAELSPTELHELIHVPFINKVYEQYRSKRITALNLDLNSTSTSNTCITHAAFCPHRSPCFVPTNNTLLNRLSFLNKERKDVFNDVLIDTKTQSVYYNTRMDKSLFRIKTYYKEIVENMMTMIYGQVNTDQKVDEEYFNDTKDQGSRVIKMIDWTAAACKTNLTSPVYLCNYNSICNLFSLSELYSKEFARIVNEIEANQVGKDQSKAAQTFSMETYNMLHSRYEPSQCDGEESCMPIYTFINENGTVFINAKNSSFASGTVDDFRAELEMLHIRYPRNEDGLHTKILEYHSKKGCHKSGRFCPYSGIQNKLITSSLKNNIKKNIFCFKINQNETERCSFDGTDWDRIYNTSIKVKQGNSHTVTDLSSHELQNNQMLTVGQDPRVPLALKLTNKVKRSIAMENKAEETADQTASLLSIGYGLTIFVLVTATLLIIVRVADWKQFDKSN